MDCGHVLDSQKLGGYEVETKFGSPEPVSLLDVVMHPKLLGRHCKNKCILVASLTISVVERVNFRFSEKPCLKKEKCESNRGRHQHQQ